jgi:predicted ATPase
MGILSIKIKNFKSIRETNDIEIKPINILIGPNGAGKSNFISFFKFLNRLYEQQLQLYINQNGRAENFLYFGRKVSDFLYGKIVFDNEWKNEYEFKMVPDQFDNLIFEEEWSNVTNPYTKERTGLKINNQSGNFESYIREDQNFRSEYLRELFLRFKIYHFHDTSFNSKMKGPSNISDNVYLHEDASNLASFLFKIQEVYPKDFYLITKTVQSIAPFFQEFFLKPDEFNPNQIFLRWKEKGSDNIFSAHNLSDGTLRMICLITLLLQPNLPDTIIIDEPELGLHPYAIHKLSALLKSASKKSQIIISTQSVSLVNEFDVEDIIVVDRENNQSVFKRLNKQDLSSWLEDYSLSDLWIKNIIGGTP